MLNETGVGGLRRRDFAGLAAEMAQLYRERGVRYFYFVDEHFLPQGEANALEYLARFEEAVGRDQPLQPLMRTLEVVMVEELTQP